MYWVEIFSARYWEMYLIGFLLILVKQITNTIADE